MNCPHCKAPLIYSDGVRCGICNNLVSETARPNAEPVRVQRMARLLARWRDHYDNLLQASKEMAHDHPAMSVVRRECAHEVLMCIHDLKAELGAGEEPSEKADR